MSRMPPSARPQRRLLTLALLSTLAGPAWAGGNCQLVDDAGATLPIDSTAAGADALACGPGAEAPGAGAVAVGDEATASGRNATSVGSWIDLDGDGLVDPDEITWAKGDAATAVGAASQALGNGTVAVGVRSVATPDNSVAIGHQAQTQAQTSTTTTTTVQGTPSNTVTTTTNGPTPTNGNHAGSIAMGDQARTNGANNIAIGTGATTEMVISSTTARDTDGVTTMVQTTMATPGRNAIAIGNGARANGNGTIVMGANARAEAKVATVITGFGDRSVVTDPGPATNSTVIGNSAASQGVNNVVIGAGAQTMGDLIMRESDPITGAPLKDPVTGYAVYREPLRDQNSTVVGASAASVRGWGSAFGYAAIAYGHQTTAIGTYSYAVGPASTSVGGYLDWGVAFGNAPRPKPGFSGAYGRAVSLGYGSQTFGSGSYTWGNYDTAVGPAALTSDRDSTSAFANDALDPTMINGSVAVGFASQAEGRGSIAVGLQSRTHDFNAIAIGGHSVAWGVDSLALGNGAIASWHQDIAIGKNAQALGGFGMGNIAFGNDALVDHASDGDTYNAMAFGNQAEAMADDATAFGHAASATGMAALAVGHASKASGTSSAAVGDGANAVGEYSAALGGYAYAGNDYAVAAGTSAFALGAGSSAFGYNSMAGGDDSTAVGSYAVADAALATAFGSGAMAVADNSVAVGAGSVADRANTVSVGAAGQERQIAHVAAGTADTDAVNVGQLNVALAGVGTAMGDLDATAVKYDDAATHATVTLAGSGGTTLSNVRAGTQAMDAVNVAQLGSLAAAFGGGATLGADGVLSAPRFTLLGGDYTTVGQAFDAIGRGFAGLDTRMTALENSTLHGGVPVGSGNGLPVGQDSIAIDADDTAIGTYATVHSSGGTAVGSSASVTADATNAVAVGADATVSAASGTAIGQGASATAQNSVALGQGSVADEAGTVSVGSAGHERRVSNVAAGTHATDAANMQQMRDGDAQAVASANAYTDVTATQTLRSANAYTDSRYQALSDEFTQLRDDIGYRLGKQDERIDRQGAMSAAMMNMSINAANSRSPRGRIAVGAGWQNGENALSVGYSKAIGERASMSIGGAFSSDDSAAGVGFGIDL